MSSQGVDAKVLRAVGLSLLAPAAVVLATYIYGLARRKLCNEDVVLSSGGQRMCRVGTVTYLMCHPIKGCGGFRLKEGIFDNAGVRPVSSEHMHDRQWVLLDMSGDVVDTNRTIGRVRVEADVSQGDPGRLRLTSSDPESDVLYVAVVTTPRQEDVLLQQVATRSDVEHARNVPVVDCGDQAAEWFSKQLMMPRVRLYQSVGHLPGLSDQCEGRAHFSSLAHCLLMTNQSLADLNANIDTGSVIAPENFRPNLVMDARDGPYAEETWQEVFICRGDAGEGLRMEFFEVAPRCKITTLDPQTGEKDRRYEPMRTLFRCRGEKKPFGVRFNLLGDGGGVREGDRVYALRRQ